MSTIVYVGPTLGANDAQRALPDSKVAAPAACGDIYRATRAGASTIVLIDGYFDQRLPVWHKEILWALSRGVRVYGGASMGALRAAELHPFGMIGVGRIFEWYLNGELESDDEVAVAHESEERQYRAASDALVNLRATFLAAEGAGVIAASTRGDLIGIARSMFYPARTLRAVLAAAARAGIRESELASLGAWLTANVEHRVDQKRLDALAVLHRARTDSPSARPQPTFSFSYTEVWHELTRVFLADTPQREGSPQQDSPQREQGLAPPQGVDAVTPAGAAEWTRRVTQLLAERDPQLAAALRLEARRRAALLDRADSAYDAHTELVQRHSDEFRHQRQLLTPKATGEWLEERGLCVAEFSEWMQEEWLIEQASSLDEPALQVQLRRVIHASIHPTVLQAIKDVAAELPEAIRERRHL